MNRDVEMALSAVKEAQISLQVECSKAYPLGTQVHVKLGAAKVVLNVVGHSHAYWSDPGAMYGVNIKTGKRREFHDRQVLEVISKPELDGPGKSNIACQPDAHDWNEIGAPVDGGPRSFRCLNCDMTKRV